MARTRFTGDSKVYPFPASPEFPDADKLAPRLDEAARRLNEKLMSLDVRALDVSEYFRRYLQIHLKHVLPSLQLYSHILFLATHGIDEESEGYFVDYGGGPGLLALLAREAGLANVIYNDIYDISCADARTLGVTLNLEADHYVLGDIAELSSYLRGRSIQCRSIASFDVIEHVYDIDSYLRAVAGMSFGPLRVVFASGANTFNPLLRRALMKRQQEAETVDRDPVEGQKLRDTTRAYRRIREEMIREHAPELADDEVRQLGAATRGMIKADIERAVDLFVQTGQSPTEMAHRTNTCDPYTGNWCEHLMDPYALARTLSASGVPATVRLGYWGEYPERWKRTALGIVNVAIRMSGEQGRRLAPYYVIYGDRR
jgi:2-polyprenyl-3-methyl-5-hydroxy-6-metoxy-1,4-benzoquinol methylase